MIQVETIINTRYRKFFILSLIIEDLLCHKFLQGALSIHNETLVKICVLALQAERVAEISCGKSWYHIKRALETLQVTEFFDLIACAHAQRGD